MNERMLIGTTIAALCLLLWWHEAWFLAETRKGRRLAEWLGADRAAWVLRGLLTLGILLGVLLAAGVVTPMRW